MMLTLDEDKIQDVSSGSPGLGQVAPSSVATTSVDLEILAPAALEHDPLRLINPLGLVHLDRVCNLKTEDMLFLAQASKHASVIEVGSTASPWFPNPGPFF